MESKQSKHEALRETLKGNIPTNPCSWVTTHQPLLSPFLFTRTGRHLNRFSIGSDPEFAFAAGETHAPAYTIGLKVGLAAGCDQNERLAELRPWPSISVVEHVAGILTALRWMWRSCPTTQRYAWRAGAFFDHDGIGGHVHFGRKRPTRPLEVLALDGLARTLRMTGIFPTNEWARRVNGDRLNQHYGDWGDIREQRHGYEYRTLPSWLQSPSIAFLVVTASKLAVIDPEITTNWPQVDPLTARNKIRGLAKLYKGRDDDAYLLYHILTRDGDGIFNVPHEADFAEAWGFTRDGRDQLTDQIILPASIRPTPEEVLEIQEHLLLGNPLRFNATTPSFKTTLPSADYIWAADFISPGRRSGYGDLIHNLVFHRGCMVRMEYSNEDIFSIAGLVERTITQQERFLITKYCSWVRFNNIGSELDTYITIPRSLCQTDTIAGLRAILLNTGIFPIWTVETVELDSMTKWLATRKTPQKPKKWRSI